MTVHSFGEPHMLQIGLCSNSLPDSARLFYDVFGFADAGGDLVYGQMLAAVQGLGDDAACVQWWMVGRQDFTQLELFTHTKPAQRPLPAGWRPCDLGWVRWGVAVPDFDATLGRLAGQGLPTITDPIRVDGLRRVCFRDPNIGVIVEVMEEGDSFPGGVAPNFYDLTPAVSYVTLSVADLDVARRFYVDTVGLTEVETVLHPPEAEALWGLEGAASESIVLSADGVFLEVVRYDDPVGRRHEGRLLSDQGIMNIAFGFRDRDALFAMYERIREAGYPVAFPMADVPATVTYVEDGEGNCVEVLTIPHELSARLGMQPRRLMTAEPTWPSRL